MMGSTYTFISAKIVVLNGFIRYPIHGHRREMDLGALRNVFFKKPMN
ncbi:hypothetical protein [Bartonella machadoae]|nr:hypothetical protein [Bartonella machadoae]UNE54036.1 hypothetical protein LNM86_10835 [Bartonella machadoae]